jgi:uncharacterized lipoprotein YmbA
VRGVLAFALVVALLGAGCARPLRRPPLQQTRFLLELPDPPAGRKTAGDLSVARVRVSSLFDRKGFIYRTGEQTYQSDVHYEFFGPPGAVLREAMISWLAVASPFASAERGSVTGARWLLETDVDQLYADRRAADATQVVLSGRFRLLDLGGAQPRRVVDQRFDEREPAGEGAPQQLVDAWGRALARALAALEPELRTAVARTRAEGTR